MVLRVGWKIKRERRFLEDTFWPFLRPKRLIMFLQFAAGKTMELLVLLVRRQAHVSSGTIWSHNTCDPGIHRQGGRRILQGKRKCENCAKTLHMAATSRNGAIHKARDFIVVRSSFHENACPPTSLTLLKASCRASQDVAVAAAAARPAWNRLLSSNSVFSPALWLTITAAAH